ncbi:MAG: hypothetical protein Q7S02_04905 [bacterium]|nr:hypothetical protein [bacterium]
MNIAQLQDRIRVVRSAIRHHRDQRGDDRCWVDDDLLSHVVLGKPDLTELPSKSTFMGRCRVFHERRRASAPAVPRPIVHEDPDGDLVTMSVDELQRVRDALIDGVRTHNEKGEAKTWKDDVALYMMLPEKDLGDLAHPDELLANCERFYEVKCAEVESGCPLRPHQW